MTLPGSCVKRVKDAMKAAINNAQNIRFNKPIRWSFSRARWATRVELQAIQICAPQEQ